MAAARKRMSAKESTATLLEFFYPIHYKLGMALEDALRGGQLTRKQVAILWLIRAEGGPEHRMPRKEIERLLTTWYEVSSSAVTKALRAMARPPLNFVEIVEAPHSGREKLVFLTPKGQDYLKTMVEAGQQFLSGIVSQLAPSMVETGIEFLGQVTTALEHLPEKSDGQTRQKRPARTSLSSSE